MTDDDEYAATGEELFLFAIAGILPAPNAAGEDRLTALSNH